MWTCPECGRSFKNQNQNHYCGKAPETIGEYIAEQPKMTQLYLERHSQCAAGGGGEDLVGDADFLEGT